MLTAGAAAAIVGLLPTSSTSHAAGKNTFIPAVLPYN
jgi:hypothetical protein